MLVLVIVNMKALDIIHLIKNFVCFITIFIFIIIQFEIELYKCYGLRLYSKSVKKLR